MRSILTPNLINPDNRGPTVLHFNSINFLSILKVHSAKFNCYRIIYTKVNGNTKLHTEMRSVKRIESNHKFHVPIHSHLFTQNQHILKTSTPTTQTHLELNEKHIFLKTIRKHTAR